MKNNQEVSVKNLIDKLKCGYAILSRVKGFSPSKNFHHLAAAGVLGVGVAVTGLYMSIWDGDLASVIPLLCEQKDSLQIVRTVAGLQNLGNNCFLNVVLQALASCSCFLPFLQDILISSDLVTEEKAEKMPLTVALCSLSEDLCITRDEKAVLNPRKVMLAMGSYVSRFNLTRQQDAAEAFILLLSSLEEEISRCYLVHDRSLADITALPSKIYKPKTEGQNEHERWQQHLLGPFDGIIGSTLTCRTCSSMISLDFEFFRCLPLSLVLDRRYKIMDDCTLVDCIRHFTAVENVNKYRCSRCWHVAALKYLSDKSEKDEARIEVLSHCVKLDSCNCKSLFLPEEITWTGLSCASKQLTIARCPRILCIHLQRASMNEYGEFIKIEEHISFPLFLDLFPFTQAATRVRQENCEENGQNNKNQQHYPLVPQLKYLNMQREMNMLPYTYRFVGENLFSEALSRKMLGKSTYELPGRPTEIINGDCNKDRASGSEIVASDLLVSEAGSITDTKFYNKVQVGTSSNSTASKLCMYRLSSVVEHYGRPGSGHYAVYRRLGSESGVDASVRPSEAVNQHWVYVSDREVSVVSEEAVLAAEASLLFYERIEACQ